MKLWQWSCTLYSHCTFNSIFHSILKYALYVHLFWGWCEGSKSLFLVSFQGSWRQYDIGYVFKSYSFILTIPIMASWSMHYMYNWFWGWCEWLKSLFLVSFQWLWRQYDNSHVFSYIPFSLFLWWHLGIYNTTDYKWEWCEWSKNLFWIYVKSLRSYEWNQDYILWTKRTQRVSLATLSIIISLTT